MQVLTINEIVESSLLLVVGYLVVHIIAHTYCCRLECYDLTTNMELCQDLVFVVDHTHYYPIIVGFCRLDGIIYPTCIYGKCVGLYVSINCNR